MEIDLLCIDMIADLTVLSHMTYDAAFLELSLAVLFNLLYGVNYAGMGLVTEHIVTRT